MVLSKDVSSMQIHTTGYAIEIVFITLVHICMYLNQAKYGLFKGSGMHHELVCISSIKIRQPIRCPNGTFKGCQ